MSTSSQSSVHPRSLPQAPLSVVDGGGFPRFGTYQGEVGEVDFHRLQGPYLLSLPLRALKHKRWQAVQVVTPEVFAFFAMVDLTYTTNAFVVVVDLKSKRKVVDESFLGLPKLSAVGNFPGAGLDAHFRAPGATFSCKRQRGGDRYQVDIEVTKIPFVTKGAFSWHGEVLASGGAPALSVVAPVTGGGVVNFTQKWAGMLASGSLQTPARTYSLDGGVAGMDYTNGYLARRTSWRWAFANGRMEDGTALGLNLVEGFNEASGDANENALWIGHQLFPLGRAKFSYDKANPMAPWKLATDDGAVDLTFRPNCMHREDRDYKIVTSWYVMPIGSFEGQVRAGERVIEISDFTGVVEDQDILW